MDPHEGAPTSGLAPGAGYHVALGRLRAFVVFLVVVHHALLAYVPGVPVADRFAGTMLWRAFPVLDPARWPLAPLLTGFNDTFFMALLFLVSGVFVSRSVERKGVPRFLRDRALRLGLPFLFAAGIVVPLAYYPAYLQIGDGPRGIAAYARAWTALEDWPTGPAWFVLLLLVFDGVAALLFRLRPGWAGWTGRLARDARERPARLFGSLVALSLAAYAPLAVAFGPEHWTQLGLLQFQTSRLLHYFVYFAVGVGIGASGLEGGLLAADGALARRWGRWTLAMLGAYLLAVAVYLAVMGARGPARELLGLLGAVCFALSCAASCFGLLALFTRFARRPHPVWRAASDDAYGIYLVHYAFVTWCQLALRELALPAAAKAALVVLAAYLLSWGTTAALRRIPAVDRVV